MPDNDLTMTYGQYLQQRGGCKIPPDLRAQIDAAIAAGRVTVIPRGKTAFGYGVYDAESKMIRMPDQEPFVHKRPARQKSNGPRSTAQIIAGLLLEGLSIEAAARRMGIAENTARCYIRDAKIAGLLSADFRPAGVSAFRQEVNERQANEAREVADMWLSGLGNAEICKAIGKSEKVVWQRLSRARQMGFLPADANSKTARARVKKEAKHDPDARDRLALHVRGLWRTGMTVRAIAEKTGVTERQIERLLERARELEPNEPTRLVIAAE